MTTIITFISSFMNGFFSGTVPHKRVMREEKAMRNGMHEDRLDAMVDDSFPASDPPSTY